MSNLEITKFENEKKNLEDQIPIINQQKMDLEEKLKLETNSFINLKNAYYILEAEFKKTSFFNFRERRMIKSKLYEAEIHFKM